MPIKVKGKFLKWKNAGDTNGKIPFQKKSLKAWSLLGKKYPNFVHPELILYNQSHASERIFVLQR